MTEADEKNTKTDPAERYHLPLQGDEYDAFRREYNAMIDAHIRTHIRRKENKMPETLLTYQNTKEKIIQQHYGNKPIPANHKNGVAAFDTVPEAEALAKELTEMLGYKHIVVNDNKHGVAVVEITKKFYIPMSEDDVTMPFLQNFEPVFGKEINVACNQKVCIDITEDGNLTVGQIYDSIEDIPIGSKDNLTLSGFEGEDRIHHKYVNKQYACMVKKITLGSLQKIEEIVFEAIKCNQTNNFNAIVLYNYDIRQAMLIVYQSNVKDVEGNEVLNGDILYNYKNEYYNVGQISLKKDSNELGNNTEYISYFWEVGNGKNEYIDCKLLKKTMWSADDRKAHDVLLTEEKEEKETKEAMLGCLVFIAAVAVVITLIVFGIRAAMPHMIETEDMTVTVVELGFALDDVRDTHESVTLKDENGVEATYRSKGNRYYIDPERGYEADLLTDFKGTNHSLNIGDKITITLEKYDNGKIKVKYGNKKLVRVK